MPLDPGPWTLDLGPWTVDPEPSTRRAGLARPDPGPWTLDPGPWTLDAQVSHALNRATFEVRKAKRPDYYALLQVGASLDGTTSRARMRPEEPPVCPEEPLMTLDCELRP